MNGKRGGLLDLVNGIYNKTQSVRFVLGITSQAQWVVPAVAIGLGVIVFIMLMSPALSSEGLSSESSSEETKDKIGQKIVQNINGLFNITGATGSDQTLIEGFIQEASFNLNFQKLLSGNSPVNITFEGDLKLPQGLCGGGVVGSNITFYNFPTSVCGPNDKKYLFFHELGHVIGNLNQREIYNPFKQAFHGSVDNLQPSIVEQDNQYPHSCYSSSGFLKSYEYAGEYGSIAGNVDESFAESIAGSLLKKRSPFADFPNDCPATYNWIRDHVLSVQ